MWNDGAPSSWGLILNAASLLLWACTQPSCPAGSQPAADGLCHLDDETESVEDTGAPVVGADPEWEVDELQAVIDSLLDMGLPDPIPVRDSYYDYIVHTDMICPQREVMEEELVTGVWLDSCTSDQGYTYEGMGIFLEEEEASDWTFSMVARFTMTSPAGIALNGGGELDLAVAEEEGEISWSSKVGGEFQLDQDATWLGLGEDISLFVEGRRSADVLEVSLNGGFKLDNAAISFQQLHVDQAVCDGLPQGELALRDPSASWFLITLADCSGCGTVRFDGVDRGELCPGEGLQAAIEALAANQRIP